MALLVEAIADELARRGVRHVFGIPGKESVRLGVELERRGIGFVAARHETQAVMMADGFWRASGRLGIALLAQGAGLANAVGGMACAARARSGVVVISGDLLKAGIDPASAKALQDLKGIDPRLIAEGVHIRYVRPASAITALADVACALDAAACGEAVYLCVPSDLFSATVAEGSARSATGTPPVPPAADPDEVDAVVELLTATWAAKRPVILAGRGAVRSGAVPALRRIGERTGALLTTTLPARSAFRGDPYDAGVCGTFATPVAGGLIAESDCVVAVGASLNPFTTYGGTIFPKKARLVHIDVSEASLGKYVEPTLRVHADARTFSDALLAALDRLDHSATGYRTAEVLRALAEYDPRAQVEDRSGGGFIDPRTLMIRLNELLPRDRTLVVDAGLHLHYACEFLEVERPEDFIFPIDSLAVGLGLGAAVGAAIARPDRTTVLEVGDGGLLMSVGDLETAARLRLRLVVVISNDQAWGAEAQHLRMLGLPDTHVRMPTPSFAALAEAMGATGHTVSSVDDLDRLAPILRARPEAPVVLDCRVHPEVQPESFNFDYAGVFAR